MKTLSFAFALLAFTTVLQAAPMSSRDENIVLDKPGFWEHLDVAKVIRTPDITGLCGIQPAQLIYQDHQRIIHELDYEVWGSGCNNGD